MNKLIQSLLFCGLLAFGLQHLHAQEKEYKVDSFNKVMISPHIEATLIEGDREMVVIEDTDVSLDKINVEVSGRTLRIYLDGAKNLTKSKKVKYNGHKERHWLYYGKQVRVTITYKSLEKLSVRGEEDIRLKSPIDQNDFELTLYGETEVMIKSAILNNLKVVMYGETYLKIENGEAEIQKYKAYGESEVDALGLANKSAKITAYGESEFSISVSDRLKVTSYGESEVHYQGNPEVDKGVVLGENSIRKI